MTTSAGIEVTGPYPALIHNQALVEVLVRMGEYDVDDPRITTEHFPPRRSGQTDRKLYLVHLNRPASLHLIVAELRKLNFRPGEARELLALGIHYRELQRQFPIVAAGSTWVDRNSVPKKNNGAKTDGTPGDRYMPFLWGLADKRTLNLNLLGGTFNEAANKEWSPACRFLAVPMSRNPKTPGD